MPTMIVYGRRKAKTIGFMPLEYRPEPEFVHPFRGKGLTAFARSSYHRDWFAPFEDRSMSLLRPFAASVFVALLAVPAGAAEEPVFNDRKMSEWMKILKEDPTPRKRRAAVVALGQIATDNKESLPTALLAVGKALKADANPAVREQAAVVLGQQKVDDGGLAVAGDLTESMRIEKEPAVRREVAIGLGRYGKVAKGAVPPLMLALKDADPTVRAAVADALGRIGDYARAAAGELLPLLKDSEKSVRLAAIFALGRIDPDDKEPVSTALVALLKGETDEELRKEVVLALSFLGDTSPNVVTALAGLLTDKKSELRMQVALGLGKFGPAVKHAEAELLAVAKADSEKQVRISAVRTLCSGLGAEAVRLIPPLSERLKDDADFEVRVAIAEELGAMGADAKSAIPALRKAQGDAQIRVREAAAAAVKKIEKPAPKPKM